ncbi:MAG TPA: M20/M25/M40 family metallo-hydrolase [Longimicrobiales bacterium]
MIDAATLTRSPAVDRARRILRARDTETLAAMVELAQIPAPPFGEAARAERVRRRFREIGLADVAVDEAGNVLARLPTPAGGARGADGVAPVLLAAHLDTIFPPGTDVTVRQVDGRWHGPGIADNARGLAAMLAVARALVEAAPALRRPVVFVATVGEEGVGDLRGVKHLFREGSPWRRAAAFIALDGTGTRRIVNRALGSVRYRIVLEGSGGHSWADWGLPNPIHALGRAIASLAELDLPRRPRTTLTVGRVEGGTAVNAIPTRAWLELDLRSESADALAELDARARRAVERAVAEAGGRRRRGAAALELTVEPIGSRPSGETPASAPIVAAARAATRLIGEVPELAASSTDANIPISLGIPAIALGAGGRSAGVHTPDEWYDNEGGPAGLERVLLTLLAVAGLDE